MAWIESHQSLATHRKLLRLMTLLDVDRPTAIGHLHLLWWWGLDNVPTSGSLKGIRAPEIAHVVDWQGDATILQDALISSGFIDNNTKHGKSRAYLQIHEWPEYAGKLCAARARNRERMKRARSGATVPNSTVEDNTQHTPPYSPPKGGRRRRGGNSGFQLPHCKDCGMNHTGKCPSEVTP